MFIFLLLYQSKDISKHIPWKFYLKIPKTNW